MKFTDAIRQLAGVRPVKLEPTRPEATPLPASQEPAPGNGPNRKAAVKDGATDKLELEAKLASLRCDFHPLYLLRNAAIEILLPKGWRQRLPKMFG